MEQKFRDRLLSLVAERFKLESIAQSASERGAQNIEELLKMLSDIGPEAAKRYPRMVWIDQIYKYLGDTRHGR